MNTVSIVFSNQDDDDCPMYLQVDPWAALYVLKKGEKIEIVAESESNDSSFHVQEFGRTTILSIANSSEFYVVVNGQRLHWEQYQLDPRLCLYCLRPLNSEMGLGEDVCICVESGS